MKWLGENGDSMTEVLNEIKLYRGLENPGSDSRILDQKEILVREQYIAIWTIHFWEGPPIGNNKIQVVDMRVRGKNEPKREKRRENIGLSSKKLVCHLYCPKNIQVTKHNSRTWWEGEECEMETKVIKEMTCLLN